MIQAVIRFQIGLRSSESRDCLTLFIRLKVLDGAVAEEKPQRKEHSGRQSRLDPILGGTDAVRFGPGEQSLYLIVRGGPASKSGLDLFKGLHLPPSGARIYWQMLQGIL